MRSGTLLAAKKKCALGLAGLILFCCQMNGLEQGTYFLFEIRESAEGGNRAPNTIPVAASVFLKAGSTTKADRAQNEESSEFERGITLPLTGSAKDLGGEDTLGNEGTDSSPSEDSFQKMPFGQTRFGEEKPPATGFHFSY